MRPRDCFSPFLPLLFVVSCGNWDDSTTYTYSRDRQLTRVTRLDGQVIDVAYDTGGRLASVTQPRGTIAFTYDTAGRPATATAPATASATASVSPEVVAFAYDGFLLTSATATGSAPGVVAYSYDNDFRVTSVSVNGAAVNFAYDADSLLTDAGALTISRDAQNGFVTDTTLGAITTALTYDTFGDLASMTSPQYSVAYTRDSLGRITRKSETLNSQLSTVDYSYDSAGRLASGASGTYTYDGNGNRISSTSTSTGTTTATFDDQDRMRSFGSNTYTYNANGDLSSKTNPTGTTSYTYDALGNLTSAVLPDATRIDYAIDALNRRIAKRVGGVVTQGFLYESQLRIAAELDATGAVVSRFVYATQANVPDLMVKGGVTYRLLHDHLGSVRLVVNTATGTIAERLDYDDWGKVTLDTAPGFQPFAFAGGLYDTHTTLTRFGARDYDAETGRWTTKEPLRFAGGESILYAYAGNEPVNRIDLNGLWLQSVVGFGQRAGAAIGSLLQQAGQGIQNIFRVGANVLSSVGNAIQSLVSRIPGVSSAAGRRAAVLRPGGHLIGQAGTSSRIRLIQGGQAEAEALFARLTQAGQVVQGSTYPGTLVRFSGDGQVGFPPISTPPTIDVFVQGIGIDKIKFLPRVA